MWRCGCAKRVLELFEGSRVESSRVESSLVESSREEGSQEHEREKKRFSGDERARGGEALVSSTQDISYVETIEA